MNVDLMRKVDFYLGKPLCAIVSLWLRLFGLCTHPKPADKPQRVLLIELSEMGSAILVDPAMRLLQQRGIEVFFVIFTKNKPSLQLLGTVAQANIFVLREHSLPSLAVDTFRLLRWCRARGIDAVIDLELFSRFTALLTGLSGATRRVGFYRFHNEGLYRGEMLTHRVAYNPHVHISKNFLSLVHALCTDVPELPFAKQKFAMPKLAKRPRDRQEMARVRKQIAECAPLRTTSRIVLVNANASDMLPQRRWPGERFTRLIDLLLHAYPQLLVLLTGSPDERQELNRLAGSVDNPRCVNLAGELEFMQLPSLYELAELMITNDSGPAHFASVSSMPTLVLFGPETPELYASLGDTTAVYAGLNCSPCVSAWNHRKTACTDNQCLKAISPERVFALAKARLDAA